MWPFRRTPPAHAATPARQEPPPPAAPPRLTAATVTRVQAPLAKRSYRSAYPDRLASGFQLFAASTREETRREIRGLIQHARHAAHNFDTARAYEMLFRRHVVGPNGIRLQMDVRDAPDRPDRVANDLIERAWAEWGRRSNSPTPCGRLSWWGVECQVATGIAREGGALVRLHVGTGTGRFGLQVEPIPFDLLDLELTMPLSDGAFIEAGMEFDRDGRPLAYHVWNRHPHIGHHSDSIRRVRIPADRMIHVSVPEEIGQALGVPRTATALRLMNMSETYQESAMAAANYGAAAMVFFKQTDSSGQLSESGDAEIPIEEIEGGTMATLPPGMEPVFNTPHYPEAAIEPFMRHMGTSQAAGMGVAYETMSGDLSRANFSSLRAGKGEERDEWRMMQRALYEGLHAPVFGAWLRMAMVTRALRLPLDKEEKFRADTWRPRGWPSVNPKDDASANQIEVALGTRTLTEICADRGRDFGELVAERAEELRLMKDAGLTPAQVGFPAAEPPPPPEDDK